MTVIRLMILLILCCLNRSALPPASAQMAPARQKGADTTGLPKYTRYKQTPAAIRAFLDAHSGARFLIADPGEKWNGGCVRALDVPHRQLVWAAFSEGGFHMQYRTGGFVTRTHYLTATLERGRVTRYTVDGEVNPPAIP